MVSYSLVCGNYTQFVFAVIIIMASSRYTVADMANLTLEDEGDVMLEETVEEKITVDGRWCLVARFIIEGAVDFLSMQQTLAEAW